MSARGIAARASALVAALASVAACSQTPPPAAPRPPSATRTLRVTGDALEGRVWLATAASSAQAAGAGPLELVGADVASEGDRVGGFVEIPPNECVLALARGSTSVGDVDLFAYDDGGDVIASDEASDADATVLICPPHPRRIYFAARVMSGAGVVGLGVQSVVEPSADAVAKASGARGRPGTDSGRLESWPGLESTLRAHRAGLGARWEDVRRAAVPVTPRAATRVSFQVDAGRCADVLVVPGDEVGSLEVVAEDASSTIVARARDRGRERSIVLCSAVATSLTVAVRPRGSQGLVAVIIGRSAVGAEAEIARQTPLERVTETRDLAEARRALEGAMSGRGYGAPKAVATGTATVGARAAFPIDLPAGCARIDVVAGRPLVAVEADLWDAAGVRMASSKAGASAPLFTCGRGGAARIDVEATLRSGPFAIELRKDEAAPAALLAHPTAASRLLARLNAGGVVGSAAAATSAEVAALDASTLRTSTHTLTAAGCVEVIAAVDEGGTGLDLRLVDGTSGESTLARSRFVVSNRICTAQAGPVKIELRLGAGKADALVLTRTVKEP